MQLAARQGFAQNGQGVVAVLGIGSLKLIEKMGGGQNQQGERVSQRFV